MEEYISDYKKYMLDNVDRVWYLYILEVNENRFYTGITLNVPKRVDSHKAGFCKATRPYKDTLKLKVFWKFNGLDMAYRIENFLHSYRNLNSYLRKMLADPTYMNHIYRICKKSGMDYKFLLTGAHRHSSIHYIQK